MRWPNVCWRPRSLRTRLTLVITALVLIVLALIGVVVYYGTARRLTSALDDSLRAATVQAMAGANDQNGKLVLGPGIEEGIGQGDMRVSGLSIAVLTPAGRLLRAAGPSAQIAPSPAVLAAARRGHGTTEVRSDPASGSHVRILTTPLSEDGKTLAVFRVALSEEPTLATLRQLRTTLLVLLPLAAVVTALLAYLLIRRALGPLDRMARMAAQISSHDLSQRLGLPPRDDEVGQLATRFDAMLERLDESFRRERQFVADASHELRTPLAAIQAIVSVTRERRRGARDYERALDDVSVEADRLRTLVEGLLELARADRQGPIGGEATLVDLKALLTDVCASLAFLAEERGLTLIWQFAGDLTVLGDGDGLVRLFVNIIDNAIKYTDAGGITVEGARAGRAIAVTVVDTGRGIPAAHVPHLFDRFFRGDASRSSVGTGLGLSIAQQIARAHGGSIVITSEEGRGTTCRVTLPAAAAEDQADPLTAAGGAVTLPAAGSGDGVT